MDESKIMKPNKAFLDLLSMIVKQNQRIVDQNQVIVESLTKPVMWIDEEKLNTNREELLERLNKL